MSKSVKTELIEGVGVDLVNDGDDIDLAVQSITEEPISELEQLRNIVFGSAKADIDARIYELQQEMHAGFEKAAETLNSHVVEMHSVLQQNVSELEDRISQVDSHYDYKTTEIDKNADKLAEEIEANNVVSKQHDDDLHKRVDHEIQKLVDQFTQKHNQTIDLLNQMKQELNSSKTDKKTLAKLLATVASNLEIEDEG